MVECTCSHYVVDYSDPERYHPDNVDREDDPACPEHHPKTCAHGVPLSQTGCPQRSDDA